MNYALESIGIGLAVFAALIVLWLMFKKMGAKAHQPAQEFQPAQRYAEHIEHNEQAEGPVLIDANAFAGDKSNIPPDAFEAEVRMLIDYGNQTAAIRVVREKMGLDLKDAKDLVDKMAQGAPIPAFDSAALSTNANEGDRDVRELAHSGHLIEAIKLVRERKGLDLKEAKDYVERL